MFACVLLCEAGKDGPFTKLRLRWLSDCFEVYLRNTNRITQQHVEALGDLPGEIADLVKEMTKMDTIVHVGGVFNETMTDLEDED